MNSTQVLAYIPSPPQGVWQLGPVSIRAYALCIVAGIIVALWWGSRRWIARGGQPGEVLDVALWAVPFGLIGGRAYHVLTDWRYYFTDLGDTLNPPRGPIDALKVWEGGLGIWGAVALGGVGAWIACRRYGIKLPAFGDAIAPPILLAQAIGRVGNYFNQEVYGRPTDLPWGLEIFRRVPDNLTGVSTGERIAIVHPTFLYEALWNVFVVLLLVAVDRYFRVGHGRLFALYVMGYCAGRFVIELLRDDAASEPFGMGIRVNSIVAVVVFACALAYFLAAPRGRELGLSMYRPARADELAAEGKVGYIDPWADDDADAPSEPEITSTEPAVPEADELEDLETQEDGAAEAEADRVEAAELDEEAADDAEAIDEAQAQADAEEPDSPSEPAIKPSEPKIAPSEPKITPSEPKIAATEPAVPEADELEDLETQEDGAAEAEADRVEAAELDEEAADDAEAIDEAQAQADAEAPVSEPDDAPEAAADADESRVIRVSRVMTAPASAIFALIADPSAQPRFDGNENLQEAAEGQRVTAVGEKFLMTNTSGRVRENTVVEFVEDRLIAWKPSEVGKTPPGHLWRWELDPIDDDTTNVAHIYDWTGLDPDDEKRNERARSTTSASLLASVNRLAELVENEPAAEAESETESDEPDGPEDNDGDRPNIVRRTDG
ncbi:MAG TPA: prolipoprotein diacylglyceryl transferase [Gordonia sp. (in: high G+C Gram-positive bacteria)]|uniref:prolipoprotein diacylglyceryl transferase n=1 Tax=Gordonia sp. (in: high G+C Gram-positive bacteria) TaxID=84139 RepID=UPI002D06E67D|nr:prolipoprotein diacylglyceryl transferase [Gordonia sp. (in: high G+C Gram-positive bacteria)]HNP57879.1 prolipoprotein diacylglyceryl transferase [Gordonia sp. (in: high G+C Gram-positive bacteria)]HRC51528.1 prolipoprotein diacylglyceryl transferase [Gordonia sp. (in: high G+C Gram-positive bacteria)]